jgi:hypothetical protein
MFHTLMFMLAASGPATPSMRAEAVLEMLMILGVYLAPMTLMRGFRVKGDWARRSRAA